MRRTACHLMLTFLLISALALASDIHWARGQQTTIVVPDAYASIQDAINHASDGYTVFVRAEFYRESIVVDKAISLIGENKETTIISAKSMSETVLILVSDNITFRGFTVAGSDNFGIIVQSSNCLITDNKVAYISGYEGIFLDGRRNRVCNNTISNNYIVNGDDAGIFVWGSSNNHIAFNVIRNNYFGVYLIYNSSGSVIERNEIINNRDTGVLFDMGSCSNTLIGNNISGNGWDNRSPTYRCGVVFNENSQGNKMMCNWVYNDNLAIFQKHASDNVIYHNNFVHNSDNDVIYQCSNVWDDGYPSGGNYWSDYFGVDEYKGPYQNITGSDGIGDRALILDSGDNVDRYPLMKPYVPSAGDLNLDGKVDVKDVAIVAAAYGSHPGDARWNPIADVNGDGRTDVRDVALVCRDYGEKRP